MKKKTSNIGNLLESPKYAECYTNLAKSRIIFISEDITHDTASSLSALLLFYDNQSETDDISIYINTNGGDALALANIYDVMQMVKSPIKTICIGKAYSAGSFILAAGTKGKRFMTKNATVMVHGLQTIFPIANQDSKHAEITFKFLKDLENSTFRMMAEHTGKSFEAIESFLKEDRYLDAKKSLEYGIVDKII